MAVQRFPELVEKLVAHGRAPDTPIAVIENGTTPKQRVIRGSLGQLSLLARSHRIRAPAMLIIGEVAKLGQSQWPRSDKRTITGLRDDLRQYS